MDVSEEELYVPDKHFTTYHTKQTCSVCGVRTTFVGQKPYINEQYCPVCGTQMNPRWTFRHQLVSDEVQLTGYQHDDKLSPVGNLPIKHVSFDPKGINEIRDVNDVHYSQNP